LVRLPDEAEKFGLFTIYIHGAPHQLSRD
jgi:hypothetical protein